MSAGEREPDSRWPGMAWLRRLDNRQYRAKMRQLIRSGRYEDVSPPRLSSAKWRVW